MYDVRETDYALFLRQSYILKNINPVTLVITTCLFRMKKKKNV